MFSDSHRFPILLALAIAAALSPTKLPAAGKSEQADGVLGEETAPRATATDAAHEARMAWWRDARFGCFIHWGPSSVLGGYWRGQKGGSYSEHIQRQLKISMADYRTDAVEKFDPEKFNADEWVKLIKSAGMRYLVITSKHHDGFAMYDSKVSDYNIVKATPFKRDPLRELKEACDKAGIKFGVYYSHAFDWGDRYAPGNDWEYKNPGGDLDLGGRNWYEKDPALEKQVIDKYVNAKAIPQIKELLLGYHPAIMWFDTPAKLSPKENQRIADVVRATSPDTIINSRIVREGADYLSTGDKPDYFRRSESGDWEAIPTTNESFGYNSGDPNHKPPEKLIRLVAQAAARGGNVLLNIGPMGDGQVEAVDVNILQTIGKWMDKFGDSIHGSKASPLSIQPWGESTLKGNILYLQVFHWPADGKIVVGGLESPVKKAWLMTTPDQPYKVTRDSDYQITIDGPKEAPDKADSVIAVEFEGDLKVSPLRPASTNELPNHLHVFDSTVHGKKIQFTWVKVNIDYTYGWSDPKEWLEWPLRLTKPATYDVKINYATKSQKQDGQAMIKVGDKEFPFTIKPTRSLRTLDTVTLGQVTLPAGDFSVAVKPVEIKDGELMYLREIILEPVKK